jgi:hypothetical protein
VPVKVGVFNTPNKFSMKSFLDVTNDEMIENGVGT